MVKVLIISFISLILSINAYAIRLGDNVSESNYKDYVVRFEIKDAAGVTSSCGGLLIGGEYILTSAQCVGTPIYTTFHSHNFWIDNGAANDITLYQGIEFSTSNQTSTTYSVVNFLGDRSSVYDAAEREINEFIFMFPMTGLTYHTTHYNRARMISTFQHDIALLKLGTKVKQKHHAKLHELYNPREGYSTQPIWVIVRGWGLDENGTQPLTMQETKVIYNTDSSSYYILNAWDHLTDTRCTNGGNGQECYYRQDDYLQATPERIGATPTTGDSGTPVGDREVYAIIKSEVVNSPVDRQVQFTHLSWYIPALASAINRVVAPTDIVLTLTNKVVSFEVQNFSGTADTLAPTMTGDSANFSVSGCEVTLQHIDSCRITLEHNGLTGEQQAVLSLNDNANTTIPVKFVNDSESPAIPEGGTNINNDESNNNTNNQSNGNTSPAEQPNQSGGGGGSISFGLFIFIALSRYLRKK
ncbi:trypsin-like serine protease [Vibrio sonorensis]|uniref:trypsin-like serine protease n=1 Tax=Vibrio sonorensis TaxID=1004316 RepID=UPI0008D91925|nr:trypsin-like serine protease [Vibrio sonorensis]